MTLDEAIKKAEGIAEEKFNNAVYIMNKMKSDIALENAEEYKQCAEEHQQLAEWLTDYKRLLEQESTTKNDLGVDYIDRKALLNRLNDFNEWCMDGRLPGSMFAVDVIKDMSPVTPQTRKGHWRPIYQGDEIIDYRCSECEFGNTFGKSTHGMNYCPNCGSDNREVEE